MSLDKAIKSGKEHRKPYRGAKAVDASCRNRGGCEWCQGNRQYKYNKKLFGLDPKELIYEEFIDIDWLKNNELHKH